MRGFKEDLPIPGNWHACLGEWASCLITVLRASKVYRMIELGCGWGCWMNNLALAASRKSLDVDIIGIDGSYYHLEKAKKISSLNNLPLNNIVYHHGIAGNSKNALFPKQNNPNHYGLEPVFNPSNEQIKDLSKTHELLSCFRLRDLRKGQSVDLLHIDIQGSEYDFCSKFREVLNMRVIKDNFKYNEYIKKITDSWRSLIV